MILFRIVHQSLFISRYSSNRGCVSFQTCWTKYSTALSRRRPRKRTKSSTVRPARRTNPRTTRRPCLPSRTRRPRSTKTAACHWCSTQRYRVACTISTTTITTTIIRPITITVNATTGRTPSRRPRTSSWPKKIGKPMTTRTTLWNGETSWSDKHCSRTFTGTLL